MIRFNIPYISGNEQAYFDEVLKNQKFCGDGGFTKKCHALLSQKLNARKVLLTTSCTHALELSALLMNIVEGDEVIMPSYTFVSTANAFALRGAKIVFVDIHPDTMNIDERLIEAAITDKTRAIVPVHYAGVACKMDEIMQIANKHQLYVVEDAAQAIGATYKGKALGTIGHFGTLSFHETKNLHCGEAGALIINDEKYLERAEILREKGTNRSKFIRGQIDKYSWVDLGSSYLPSELNAAFLLAQLEKEEEVTRERKNIWKTYYEAFKSYNLLEKFEISEISDDYGFNAHIFYIKAKNIEERQNLINHLKMKEIQSVFHYIPLHSALAGSIFASFNGIDKHTTRESEKLLRLPLYYGLEIDKVKYIVETIYKYFL